MEEGKDGRWKMEDVKWKMSRKAGCAFGAEDGRCPAKRDAPLA
ncbi:MAG: hypothetical protein ACM34J_08940 [Ignavibacteria bacterium]